MKRLSVILICVMLIALLALPCMAATSVQMEDAGLYTMSAAPEADASAEDEELVDKDALVGMIIVGVAVVVFGLAAILLLGRKKPMPPTHGFETKQFLEDKKEEQIEE